MTNASVEIKRTYCKICMTACGLVAEVQGNRIQRVRGDKDHPLFEGYTCPKGRATGQLHHRDDAITRPLMRKDGELVEVGWDEALDDVAAKLRRVLDTYGPDYVGLYFGSGLGLDSSGYTMEDAFYKHLGTPPKFSPLTNDSCYEAMLTSAVGRGVAPKVDYHHTMMLLYVGINPMISHGDNNGMWDPATWLRSITKRGGEIWTIDPHFTATANLSTGHIAAYPGKDYAILAWIVKEIIDNGPLKPKQPVQGLDELRAALGGYDRATAAEVAGVTEEEIQDLLDAIRRAGIVSTETGTGIGMSPGANLTAWFCWLIMILTGSTNEKGGAWFHPGFFYPLEIHGPYVPKRTFFPGSRTRPDIKALIGPGGGPDWPCATLGPEIETGNIRAFFNFGGNIIRSFPDANALTRLLPTLELNVVTEIRHNAVVSLSTHVLPTKDCVERPEITRWDSLGWNVSMQYSPPLVAPMGERRSAWWVISQFMKRAGIPVPTDIPDDDRVEGADEFMLSRQFTSKARCSFEELKEKRYVEFPLEHPADWVERHFARVGGWMLTPPELVEQWNRFRAADDANLGQPRPLVFTPRRQFKQFNGNLDLLGEPANILINPQTAQEHGIIDGQDVKVRTKSGQITLIAKVDPKMREGVCSISHGHAEGNVNELTSRFDMDPLGGMAHNSAVPIDIEPAVPSLGNQAAGPTD
ncbi:MAG: molybdopterin-dependent oxidoreductase [Acidimicrobiales bacterium]